MPRDDATVDANAPSAPAPALAAPAAAPDGTASAPAPLPIPLPRTATVEQVTGPRPGSRVVVVRRRRIGPATAAVGEAPDGGAAKAPRVHRVDKAADGLETAATEGPVLPRRRRRRDPLRAPGAVVRTVFEPPAAPAESETLRRLAQARPPGPSYGEVQAAIDELSRIVAQALSASRWRAQ